MSNAWNSTGGLDYRGTRASRPINTYEEDRDPTVYDISPYQILDEWLNKRTLSVWKLISLANPGQPTNMGIKGSYAKWVMIIAASGDLISLSADDGNVALPLNGNILIHNTDTNIITSAATPNTVTLNLSNGTNGQLLIGGGTHANWANITAGADIIITNGPNSIEIASTGASTSGLVLLQTQTGTNVTTLPFTTGITSTYNNYRIIVDSLNCPTASSDMLFVQLSTDGGSTYITTGYDNSGTGIGLNLGSANVFQPTSYLSLGTDLMNLTSGVGYVISTGSFTYYNTSTSTITNNLNGSAYDTPAVVVNAIRFIITASKAFTATVSLYGYLN